MYPVLFEIGSLQIYSYGFMIALGIVAGVSYLTIAGKKELGLSFDQANALFLYIFFAAVIGGKVFLFFEAPAKYLSDIKSLFAGRGFVFYGSFLFAVPVMLWFFKKNKLDAYRMLDIMAIVTCLVHIFGRLGCFLAGCCYGIVTTKSWGVVFSDPLCVANPKHVPLHPTQLYEAGFIFLVMLFLFWFKSRKRFNGQLFLFYLMFYAVGRFIIEYFRGDDSRGYFIEGWISHSQAIAILIFMGASVFYIIRANAAKSVIKSR